MKKTFILLLALFLVLSCIKINTGKDQMKHERYKGVITKIYQDESNHFMNTFEINAKTRFIEIANYYPKSWEYAQVGDSIIKPPDTLMIIIKKNDTTQKEFFYKF